MSWRRCAPTSRSSRTSRAWSPSWRSWTGAWPCWLTMTPVAGSPTKTWKICCAPASIMPSCASAPPTWRWPTSCTRKEWWKPSSTAWPPAAAISVSRPTSSASWAAPSAPNSASRSWKPAWPIATSWSPSIWPATSWVSRASCLPITSARCGMPACASPCTPVRPQAPRACGKPFASWVPSVSVTASRQFRIRPWWPIWPSTASASSPASPPTCRPPRWRAWPSIRSASSWPPAYWSASTPTIRR